MSNNYFEQEDSKVKVLSIVSLVLSILGVLGACIAFFPMLNFIYVFYIPFIFGIASLIVAAIVNSKQGRHRISLFVFSGVVTFIGFVYIMIAAIMLMML